MAKLIFRRSISKLAAWIEVMGMLASIMTAAALSGLGFFSAHLAAWWAIVTLILHFLFTAATEVRDE